MLMGKGTTVDDMLAWLDNVKKDYGNVPLIVVKENEPLYHTNEVHHTVSGVIAVIQLSQRGG